VVVVWLRRCVASRAKTKHAQQTSACISLKQQGFTSACISLKQQGFSATNQRLHFAETAGVFSSFFQAKLQGSSCNSWGVWVL
jgi:hypothetical protein